MRFQLTRIAFPHVAEHVRRAAGIRLPSELGAFEWIYLSGFRAALASPAREMQPQPRGLATAVLKTALAALPRPAILCCEPLLGSDPRSLTPWTEHMTDTERTAKLCRYYQTCFGLRSGCAIDCTLRTTLTGRGQRWAGERQFLWGLIDPATIAAGAPRPSDSRERVVLLS